MSRRPDILHRPVVILAYAHAVTPAINLLCDDAARLHLPLVLFIGVNIDKWNGTICQTESASVVHSSVQPDRAHRFTAYEKYLIGLHPHPSFVLMLDGLDTRIVDDPFPRLAADMASGCSITMQQEWRQYHQSPWLATRFTGCGLKDAMTRVDRQAIANCGVMGGAYGPVLSLLHDFGDAVKNSSRLRSCADADMVTFASLLKDRPHICIGGHSQLTHTFRNRLQYAYEIVDEVAEEQRRPDGPPALQRELPSNTSNMHNSAAANSGPDGQVDGLSSIKLNQQRVSENSSRDGPCRYPDFMAGPPANLSGEVAERWVLAHVDMPRQTVRCHWMPYAVLHKPTPPNRTYATREPPG